MRLGLKQINKQTNKRVVILMEDVFIFNLNRLITKGYESQALSKSWSSPSVALHGKLEAYDALPPC